MFAIRFLVLIAALYCVHAEYSADEFSNSTLSSCTVKASCKASGVEGICVSKASGCCKGSLTINLCPGDADEQCCHDSVCSTPQGSGTCMQTSLCSERGGVSVKNYCDGPADLQCCVKGSSGKITRDEIISRAQDWVNRRIPYSQTDRTDGYRQDCSGMVSMAWRSSTAGGGHTTRNMLDICTKISRSAMTRGDALLHPGEHVLIFDKWVDNDNFMEYAEHTYGQVASHDKTSYSLRAGQGYFPCRFNSVA